MYSQFKYMSVTNTKICKITTFRGGTESKEAYMYRIHGKEINKVMKIKLNFNNAGYISLPSLCLVT